MYIFFFYSFMQLSADDPEDETQDQDSSDEVSNHTRAWRKTAQLAEFEGNYKLE